MDKQWYVIHAYSGYETKVREALLERIERLGMSDFFGEIMVPSEEVVEMKGGQERKTQRKFAPAMWGRMRQHMGVPMPRGNLSRPRKTRTCQHLRKKAVRGCKRASF